jgi:two-component sensor histidine kinase
MSATPLRVTGERICGCIVTMLDVSQRKAAQRQLLMLMDELDHRVKNTLALVLSLSSHTAASADSVESYTHALTGRIQSLAATHSLLAERSWQHLSLSEILSSELLPYDEAIVHRVAMQGLDVAVAPRAAIAVGLILHELIANAVKYGALSRPAGRIVVRNAGRTGQNRGALVLEWRESGGPPVSPPQRPGFGHAIIARCLQYSPQGGAEVAFNREGLVCRLFLPAEDLRDAA